MPSFYNLVSGATAQSQDVQQIIDALKGTAGLGIPLSPTAVNDSVNFALAVKNTESVNSRALQVLKSTGLVMLQADVNGVVVSPDGVAAASQIVVVNGAQTVAGLKTFSGGLTVSAGVTTIIATAASGISLQNSVGGNNQMFRLWDGTNNFIGAQGNGDIFVGLGASGSGLATNATAGFCYIPAVAGTPTGTPTNSNLIRAAIMYDTTNHKFWAYDTSAAAWRGVALA